MSVKNVSKDTDLGSAQSLADRIVEYHRNIEAPADDLPEGFKVLNPFRDNPETLQSMQQFYRKFYNDNLPRRMIIGINPSRHGSGVTGVPFTDTKRLNAVCGIPFTSVRTHEVSSVYMYDMIEAYGGPEKFFGDFYINSPFPLALVRRSPKGNEVNVNYYDHRGLAAAVRGYMTQAMRDHIALGLDTTEAFILGKKNAEFIKRINEEEQLFDRLTVLEHPRYIQQYKSKEKELYIDKYLKAFYGME
ncbi:MAG: SMUG2 DNA glycosylase family protein [Chryseobacterium sp.]|nr:MAG: SMUG2 DNA glycosylase family protein [Chryseobacterium sp.]